MKWSLKEPKSGDMIRVSVGALYHFGIYVSDDEVIQFGHAPNQRALIPDSEVEVLSSDIDTFLAGGFLEVCEFDRKEKKKNRRPDEIVAYAREKIGTRGYSFLFNNCEHFANECVSGNRVSEQSRGAIEIFRKLPQLDVYIAPLPEEEPKEPLINEERWQEVCSAGCERVRREKYYAWRLLEYAAKQSFKLSPEELLAKKSECGAWQSEKLHFSISHSGGAIAVCVSSAPCGVDIEPKGERAGDRLAERTMTGDELAEYRSLPEKERPAYFTKKWCAKEAIFKSSGESVFVPSSINTLRTPYRQGEVEIMGKAYVYSVAAPFTERTRIFKNVKFS